MGSNEASASRGGTAASVDRPRSEAEASRLDFVSGGYVLARPFMPPEDGLPLFFPKRLVGRPVITVSPCIAEMLPSDCCLFAPWPPHHAAQLREEAADWGITATEAAEEWARRKQQDGRIPWGEAFSDLEDAREVATRFVSPAGDLRLLGIAMERDRVEEFLAAYDVFVTAQEESSGAGGPRHRLVPSGVRDLVSRRLPVAPDGRALGYEVLDVVAGESRHSWHCQGIEQEMHDRFGVRLASGGMIPDAEDARRVATVCDAEQGEPGVWRAWLVTEYPLSV